MGLGDAVLFEQSSSGIHAVQQERERERDQREDATLSKVGKKSEWEEFEFLRK
jgi:hypothetical protein